MRSVLAGRLKLTQIACWSLRLLTVASVVVSTVAVAATPGAECLEVVIDEQRLQCFERTIGRAVAAAKAGQAEGTPETPPAVPALASGLSRPSMLDNAWGFDRDSNESLIRLYHPNYGLFGRYTSDVNTAPYESLLDIISDGGDVDSVEAKFQLSFKARLWAAEERDWGVWFAYTQQNHWQVYNDDVSSPFRETNYMPEVIASFRPGMTLGDWHWNQLNVGFTHQSNGRSDPISRSWNRVFVEGGIERADFALLARAWARIEESDEEDDNPDITDYMGYGELTGIWKRGDSSYTLMVRGNPSTGKGAGQFTWMSRPLLGPLKAYVQVFSGYGESMIDYDWNQTTVGVGVALNDRL
jgi:phospholipase A1